eukprot:746066_1
MIIQLLILLVVDIVSSIASVPDTPLFCVQRHDTRSCDIGIAWSANTTKIGIRYAREYPGNYSIQLCVRNNADLDVGIMCVDECATDPAKCEYSLTMWSGWDSDSVSNVTGKVRDLIGTITSICKNYTEDQSLVVDGYMHRINHKVFGRSNNIPVSQYISTAHETDLSIVSDDDPYSDDTKTAISDLGDSSYSHAPDALSDDTYKRNFAFVPEAINGIINKYVILDHSSLGFIRDQRTRYSSYIDQVVKHGENAFGKLSFCVFGGNQKCKALALGWHTDHQKLAEQYFDYQRTPNGKFRFDEDITISFGFVFRTSFRNAPGCLSNELECFMTMEDYIEEPGVNGQEMTEAIRSASRFPDAIRRYRRKQMEKDGLGEVALCVEKNVEIGKRPCTKLDAWTYNMTEFADKYQQISPNILTDKDYRLCLGSRYSSNFNCFRFLMPCQQSCQDHIDKTISNRMSLNTKVARKLLEMITERRFIAQSFDKKPKRTSIRKVSVNNRTLIEESEAPSSYIMNRLNRPPTKTHKNSPEAPSSYVMNRPNRRPTKTHKNSPEAPSSYIMNRLNRRPTNTHKNSPEAPSSYVMNRPNRRPTKTHKNSPEAPSSYIMNRLNRRPTNTHKNSPEAPSSYIMNRLNRPPTKTHKNSPGLMKKVKNMFSCASIRPEERCEW